MAEFKIKISDFLGKNIKSDPTDHNNHEAQELDGFEISTKPGALVKRKGYTDQANVVLPESYPSNWTIKNFFQFRVNKPSKKEIMMVHAIVGGEDRIYVDYTYDGSSWNQGWVELTEKEEDLTMSVYTDNTQFQSTELSSTQADYYNGWYYFNWDYFSGSIVEDYDGTTITLKSESAGLANSKFSIYRFPIVVNVEKPTNYHTADTGSSTTQVYDIDNGILGFYELTQDYDDAYNGWTLFNNTVVDTQTITDYEAFYAGNTHRITHGAIAGQGEDDEYALYKKERGFYSDDKIQFRQRPNVALMATGNTARYPKQYPLWYGYIRETYYFGDTTNKIDSGYYLETQILDAPDDAIFSCDTTSGSIGSTDYFYFSCAYIYDGYQIGQMTSIKKSYAQRVQSTDGDDAIRMTFDIGYSKAPNMRHSKVLNKRVTGIAVYATTDIDFGSKSASWNRIATIPIREDTVITSSYGNRGGSRTNANEGRPETRTVITNGGRTNRTSRADYGVRDWTGGDKYSRTFDLDENVWANKSNYYTLDSGGMNGDMVNYLHADETMNHSIIANCFLNEPESSLAFASPFKDNGTPSPDFYPLDNIIDYATYGIHYIYSVKVINDYVYILGDTKSIRLVMSSGLDPAFKLEKEYEYLGTNSPNSIVKHKEMLFGLFKDGFHVISGDQAYVSFPIENITNYPIGVTDISEGYAVYYPYGKKFYTAFPTDQKIFTYDPLSRQWETHSVNDGINSLVVGINNEIYGASGTKIFRLDNGTSDDSENISPSWKSKIYSFGNNHALLRQAIISYKSNTPIQFDIYLDRGTAASWLSATDNQLAASAIPTTIQVELPLDLRGNEFELGITIPTASLSSNTDCEIYDIEIIGEVEERV